MCYVKDLKTIRTCRPQKIFLKYTAQCVNDLKNIKYFLFVYEEDQSDF